MIWLQIYPWLGELCKALETGQVIISREILSWLVSCTSLFRITECLTGSFQPKAITQIYNVLNCFFFSSSPAGRWTCTISVLLCVVLSRIIIKPTKLFYFLLCAHCKEISVSSTWSLFIFIFSSCWDKKLFLLYFVCFYYTVFQTFSFNSLRGGFLETSHPCWIFGRDVLRQKTGNHACTVCRHRGIKDDSYHRDQPRNSSGAGYSEDFS